MGHDSIANRMDGRPVGIVELDALVRLEVAAHRRAEAVGLVNVRLVRERNRATKPCVARPGRPTCGTCPRWSCWYPPYRISPNMERLRRGGPSSPTIMRQLRPSQVFDKDQGIRRNSHDVLILDPAPHRIFRRRRTN